MAKSFWTIPSDSDIVTPIAILKEQATALSEGTSGMLEGNVTTNTFGSDIILTMEILVSALNGYRVEILEYTQPIQIYPGTLKLHFFNGGARIRITSASEFQDVVHQYLSSNEMTNVLRSLLSQIKHA